MDLYLSIYGAWMNVRNEDSYVEGAGSIEEGDKCEERIGSISFSVQM